MFGNHNEHEKIMSNEHYICTGGCNGVSSTAGVCNADGCPKKGQPLAPCQCTKPEHLDKFTESENGKEDSEEVMF